jgi:hypothetical protein
MHRVLIWIVEFVVTLLVIMGALLTYDVYKHGTGYLGTPLFHDDVNFDGRIALTGAIIIFLVDVCYQATRQTLRMGPGPGGNDLS